MFTFIPNSIISLSEVRIIYRLFNNNSYIGVSTNNTNASDSFRTLSKVTELSNETFNKNYSGTIDGQYYINVLFSEFTKLDRVLNFILSSSNKVRRSYFDKIY